MWLKITAIYPQTLDSEKEKWQLYNTARIYIVMWLYERATKYLLTPIATFLF